MSERETAITYVLFLLDKKVSVYKDMVKLFKDKNIDVDKEFFDQIIKLLSFDVKINMVTLKKALLINDNKVYEGFPRVYGKFYSEVKKSVNMLIHHLNNRRSVIFIPLLSEEEKYRIEAINYVDKHLQYSLNDLQSFKYKDCLDDIKEISFISEVIKCMIATDILAKTVYYKDADERWSWNNPERPHHEDEIRYREGTEHASKELFDLEMDLFDTKVKDMETRIVEYSLLSAEDILRLDYLIADPPIRFVACLTSGNSGFIAMVYMFFSEKSINVYGIRTTIFGLSRNERGIAKDLIGGIIQYGRKLGVENVKIIKTPVGPMEDILLSTGFVLDADGRYTKTIESTGSDVVDIVDLGCGNLIFKDDRLHKNILL